MKRLFYILFFALCLTGLPSSDASAQTLTVLNGMDFGDFATDNSGGTIVLDVDDTATYNGIIDLGGTPRAAAFSASGPAFGAYSLTLPSDPSLVSDGTNTMTLTSWVTNSVGTFDGAGNVTFEMGATLTMGTGQPVNTYTASLNLTINNQ